MRTFAAVTEAVAFTTIEELSTEICVRTAIRVWYVAREIAMPVAGLAEHVGTVQILRDTSKITEAVTAYTKLAMAVGILTCRTEEDTNTVFATVGAVGIGGSEFRAEIVAVPIACQAVIKLLEAVRITDGAEFVAEPVKRAGVAAVGIKSLTCRITEVVVRAFEEELDARTNREFSESQRTLEVFDRELDIHAARLGELDRRPEALERIQYERAG